MLQETFISAVMNRPALWQSKHPNYRNKFVHVKLWSEIKEMFPKSDVAQLKKRWKNLKDNYRKELKKTLASGNDVSDICGPQWRYFEIMSFIRDELIPTDAKRSKVSNTIDEKDYLTADVDSMDNPAIAENIQSPGSDESADSYQDPLEKPAEKRQTPNEIRTEYLEIEKRKLQLLKRELSNKDGPSTINKSDDYYFLMSILPGMEKLPPIKKFKLRNKINELIMEEIKTSNSESLGYSDNGTE